ncbi:ubiquitin C-terminal hydrolase 13-like isoform X2 [Macadamia integrifolia]|uniref:ubiquitin C-terminal hydrolase 13-like isoform X2 n=1 Tax=Macadamia integrifolia TaxID=60698 RepID=UPI001C4EC7AD|nr:ubiquitin C-terminal hydrolase 13-like isoform X2 [Macadamia integrifolia]
MSVEPFVVLDDPCKIRLAPHDCFSKQPYFQPISYLAEERLSDMLVRLGQTSDILYYEVLDNPVPEYESLCTLIVAFHSAVKDEVVIHEIRLAKDNRIENVFDYPRAKDHHPHQKLESWNSYLASLRVEEIPEEENDLTPQDRLIPVVHFTRDTSGMHMDFGVPFFIIIYEGETLAEIKVRVQNKLQVPDKKFVKWKFIYTPVGHKSHKKSREDLKDSDILSRYFEEKKTYGEFLEYLGLEHCDDTRRRAYVVDQSCLTFGRREKRLKW